MSNIYNALKKIARSNIFKKIKVLHRNAFSDKYLLSTNLAISFSLSSVGDLIEQQYEKKTEEIEKICLRRTLNMGISGGAVGVITHYWYQILDRRLPGNSITLVMKKILLDQVVCSPIYICAVFVTVGLLEHQKITEIWDEIKYKAWKLYVAEWAVWPAAQFINFYWLSPKHRMFYDSVISLGYDVYTSRVKYND